MFTIEANGIDLGLSLGGAPTAIQYLPAGRSEINATVDGSPKAIEVNVDENAVQVLQAALDKRLAENVRPIIDFDHNDTGPAAGIPKRFFWVEGLGVMLEVDWTKAGAQAIEGRDYSYFSPLFIAGKDGQPIGLDSTRPIGGLVNDPAFRQIKRIAAKQAGKPKETPLTTNMSDNKTDYSALIEAKVISASQAKDGSDAVNIAIAAAFSKLKDERSTLEAKLKKADEENQKLTDSINEAKLDEAKTIVAKAVQEGRIQKKDEAGQKFWTDLIVEKGESAKTQIAALAAPNVAPIVPLGGVDTADGAQSVQAAHAAKIANRAREIAKTEGINFIQAFPKAKAEFAKA